MRKTALLLFIFLSVVGAALAESAYPLLDISGFKKWEYKKADVSPNRNYFTGLTYLGGYYPTFTGGPWQERLQLKILGQLSQNLSVAYDLEQQPENPDKFDVKVKYFNNELTFGDFSANFTGNEFVSASKYLNGVMLTAKENWYDIVAVPSAKLKSQTQSLTAQKGTSTRGPYNLGHGSIVEGSEQIQLNNIWLTRNVDYTIDYFEGKVTFNRLLSQTDEFKYTYEYTNILDLFFPSLSKRDFFGFQSRFAIDPEQFGKPLPEKEPVISQEKAAFPSSGSLEPEVIEGESSGRYQLKFTPIVKLSEVLTFMGTQLKKNEDYIIRYDTGEIKLLTRFLPTSSEAMTVEYKYYLTSLEAEAIPGIGSRGPYRISRPNPVPESERIEVDGKLFVRDLDYSIKYDTGEIIFGVVIGPTSQIKISYRYNAMALPSAAQSKFPKELKVGMTYLKETAKKGAGAPTISAIESYTGQNLIASNYLINLKNRPILPTSEASLTVWLKRGATSRAMTWESEYVVPTTEVDPATGFYHVIPSVQLGYITDRTDPTDGYGTGTIYLLKQDLTASDEVTVTYTYKRSVVGKYNGTGDGSKGTYYLRNVREICPGTETLQVWDQGSSVITTYTRNTSFEGNAGDTGYSINYNRDNPSITFNKELASNKNFQVIYQYVPPANPTGGDISQSALGLDGSFKIGEVFKIDSSYAKSDSDQLYIAETTIEGFAGTGSKNYTLHSPKDIIDGSEQIYVNQRLLNRDIDYYISYTSPGQFTFYYITPSTQDAISVQYNYQSLSGADVGTKTKSDTAARLGAETRLFGDVLTINGTTKRIGFDFSPLGGTAIGVGSEYEEYNTNLKPVFHSSFLNYSYKYNKQPLGISRKTFMRTYDNSVTAGINPGGLAKIDFNYRTYFSLDDPLAVGALHNSDNLQESYSASLVPAEWKRGAIAFIQKYDLRKTVSKTDVVDRGATLSTATIDYDHVGLDLKLTDRVGMGFDYQINEPNTVGSLETKTAHTRSVDSAYNLSLDLTMGFLKKWTARLSLLNHYDYTFLPTPETAASTKNETYHIDLNPYDFLTSALDHNRQEKTSYVSGGENPRSIRTTGNARLAPVSWFSAGVNAAKGETIPETGGANKTTSRTINYDADYTPISFSLIRFNARFLSSTTYQTAPLGSEHVKTDTDTLSQNYTLGLTPLPFLPFNFGFIQEDYKNRNNSVTSPVTTETQNQSLTAAINLSPLPQLTLGADYNRKITKDLLAQASRPKTLTNGKISYQVFSWGTLLYDINEERNLGEVQAGSVVDLNFRKTTQTLSFNFTIPFDNPVLTGLLLQASLKQVDYLNYKNSTDDFKASLMSFEGTLNF